MSQQKGMSFKEFRELFQTEEACEAYLFQRRWPEGFVCPKCGGTGCYQLRGRREYVCKYCHRQSSVTVGTVLHRTHLPLTIWFWAIYLVVRDKQGISAVQLSHELVPQTLPECFSILSRQASGTARKSHLGNQREILYRGSRHPGGCLRREYAGYQPHFGEHCFHGIASPELCRNGGQIRRERGGFHRRQKGSAAVCPSELPAGL